jgi:hypothetical protein
MSAYPHIDERAESAYLHALEGRLRIKIPAVKRSAAAAADIEALLRTIEGVASVVGNPRTGNVLVLYDPARTTQPLIIATLRTAGFLRPPVGSGGGRARDTLADMVLRVSVEFALQRLITVLI